MCYSLSFVEREIQSLIKKNNNYTIQAVFHVSLKGEDYITNKETCLVPSWLLKMVIDKHVLMPVDPESLTDTSNSQSQSNPAKVRVGKGTPPLLVVRKLMNEKESWKYLVSKKDYQYPGVFSSSQMQCVFYAPDYTKLQQSPDHDWLFM